MTKVWNYGKAGDTYQVRDGDVWYVGEHTFLCGDLARGDGMRLLELGRQRYASFPQMFYSDPPWDLGNAKSFRTKAGRPDTQLVFSSLISKVLAVARYVAGDIYVEMGQRHMLDLQTVWFPAAGINYRKHWEITYYNKHKCILLLGTVVGANTISGCYGDARAVEFAGMDDEHTPRLAIQISSVSGDIVVEPCLGLGATSRAAQREGRRCLAMELHPRRLACSISDLVARGCSAVRVRNIFDGK